MRTSYSTFLASVGLAICFPISNVPAADGPYRLPTLDLKSRVIWGSKCEEPAGAGLAFGGQDQDADIGKPPTEMLVDGKWESIRDELEWTNPLQSLRYRCEKRASQQRLIQAQARRIYFEGAELASARQNHLPTGIAFIDAEKFSRDNFLIVQTVSEMLGGASATKRPLDAYQKQQIDRAVLLLKPALTLSDSLLTSPQVSAKALESMRKIQVSLEQVAECLDCEPPGRTLSPIAYDSKSKLYVIFGGDHLDYLTNDTWTFDPEKKKWQQRHPSTAPPPRANHTLKSAGDGKIVLSGGYTYANNTDYMGGQYKDWKDGDWTYDIAEDKWTGEKPGVEVTRQYRTGPFLPEFFFEGAAPERKTTNDKLSSLPANTWVSLKPPQLPQMQRDWGTAVLDPDHDLILRFSGGHCAHGGSDVLMYHINTNRWELPFPVEFPLGQLYSNTSYPGGFNLNRRPWVTGHTYQSYGYDLVAHKMLFTGHTKHTYVFDPLVADWTGRFEKPKSMSYGDSFYTLTICSTPEGLVCWTHDGKVLRFDAKENQWERLHLKGDKLPGSVVDNSTLVCDENRDRLLFARKEYGDKTTFNGVLHALDVTSGEVKMLTPAGSDKANAISYLCQLRYDKQHELVLCGCTLPPDADGFRRTPAYDCRNNRWVSLKIIGDDPSGKNGRNVSLGMMYDAIRKLFWAVDTHSHVFVLKLDPEKADLQPL